MYSKDPDGSKNAQNGQGTSPQSAAKPTTGRATGSRKVKSSPGADTGMVSPKIRVAAPA